MTLRDAWWSVQSWQPWLGPMAPGRKDRDEGNLWLGDPRVLLAVRAAISSCVHPVISLHTQSTNMFESYFTGLEAGEAEFSLTLPISPLPLPAVVFPQDLLEKGLEADNFAMLGLGDIVIPGNCWEWTVVEGWRDAWYVRVLGLTGKLALPIGNEQGQILPQCVFVVWWCTAGFFNIRMA